MSFSTVTLSEIASPIIRPIEVVPGISYRTIGVKWWGEGAYERETIDGTQTAAKTLSIVRENDLIINKIWVRHGSTAIASKAVEGCAASGEFPTFELDNSRILPRWMHWLTKTRDFWQKCDNLSRGTSGKNRIRPELFLTIEIPLPPLKEQQRIVVRIEELAAKVEEARGLRQGIVEEIEALWASETANILSYSRWANMTLGSILLENSQNGLSTQPSHNSSGIPILRISAATSRSDALVDENDYKYIELNKQDYLKYKVEPGDLLVCRFNGNLHYVGKFALYKQYLGKTHVYPDKLIRLRVDTEKVLPEFIRFAANSPIVRKSIEAFCATTAGNIGISAGNLKSISVPVPPLIEQRRIVTYLDDLQSKTDALKRTQAKASAELETLLPSILDKAFKGEL